VTAEIVVCCGVGGAGKTTTSAALGVGHALAGRRVVVLTIDPARRLADALGLPRLGNSPHRIALAAAEAKGGRLDALMLDRKATFDELVRRDAPDPAVAERLLGNPYYRALSTRLTGGHEYMATEKLHALATDGTWDLVVVDTPPSLHALDFFRAPDRIRRLLDQRFLGALLRPTEGLLGVATRSAVGLVRRLAGEKVIGDLEEFFALVSGLSAGLRTRGAEVHDMLRDPRCSYLLVANAAAPRLEEMLAFLDALRDEGQHFGGFLLNRAAAPLEVPLDRALAAIPPAPPGVSAADWAEVAASLRTVLARRADAVARDADLAGRLAARARAPVWRVPEVEGGVGDLPGLVALSRHLPPAARPTDGA
jgi:anion-transporting  ArsA/GET3 family ATPase